MSIRHISTKWHWCKINKCASRGGKHKCVFCVNPKDQHVILDCDKILAIKHMAGRMSDCIIFVQKGKIWVGVVELKSTTYEVGQVIEQLRAGCDLALKILDEVNWVKDYEVKPILVAKHHPHSECMLVQQASLTVRGRRYYVTTATCSDMFVCK